MDNQNYQTFSPSSPGAMSPTYTTQPASSPNASSYSTPGLAPVKKSSSIGRLVALILVSIIAIVFIGLFIWALSEKDAIQADVDGQINKAVAIAVNEKATELEASFLEREKSPYSTFAGPEDYGALTFNFPKTWSVYIDKDASKGGNFESYFNPGAVYPLSDNNINALRAIILDQSYDVAIKAYESRLKSGKLTVNVRLVGGENANVYTGELPSGGFVGAAAVFSIRDKTVVIQTDANAFLDDFYRVLDTVQYTK